MDRLFVNLLFVHAILPFSLFAQIGKQLPVSASHSQGLNPSFVKKVCVETSHQIPSLGAFLVWRKDTMIYEGYFHGQSHNTAFNIKSATKSFLSAIAGAAIMRGYLTNLDTSVLNILPEYEPNIYPLLDSDEQEKRKEIDSLVHSVTMRHLLTMQAGFSWDESTPIVSAYSYSSDRVRFVLELPFSTDPGEQFVYSTGAAHVFGAALSRLIKTDLKTFADSTLFKPAGITVQKWATDTKGRYNGGSEMYLTAQDMMRFGILYLKKGKLSGHQILQEKWVNESLAGHIQLNKWDVLPGANGYGYYWWRRLSHGQQVYVASGYGGQLICIMPDLDMVIVTTCTLGDNNRGRSEIKRLHLQIDKIIEAAKM